MYFLFICRYLFTLMHRLLIWNRTLCFMFKHNAHFRYRSTTFYPWLWFNLWLIVLCALSVVPKINHVTNSMLVMFLFFLCLFSDTRESAFVNAIMSAGVVYSITSSCSDGTSMQCGCDNSIRDVHVRAPSSANIVRAKHSPFINSIIQSK